MKSKTFLIFCFTLFFVGAVKTQPLQHRLLIAASLDGLNFTKLNKILYNFSDVPDAVVSSSGYVYVYFQGIIEPLHDIITVGISNNGIDNWYFQPVKIFGIEDWLARPCDPDVIYKDGQFRLYFTGDPINDRIPETYSAVSNDGINFTLESGVRFSGGNFQVLDPSLLWIGDTLHYFAGGKTPTLNWHAISTDGLIFTKVEDFYANGMMMSNGIKVNNGYRFYGFLNFPPQNIRSIFTLDRRNWITDTGIRLELDTANALEGMYVKDPAIIFKDSVYIMYYVTRKREYSNVETNSPQEFRLSQNFPNPFNPITTIKFSIPNSAFITLKVYDVLGKEIATLVDEIKPSGNYVETLHATSLPSGTYFYQVRAGSYVETKKMLLLR